MRFLEALAGTCNVVKACKVARVGRQTVYDWRDTDPKFAEAWLKAKDQGADVLESEAVRRATVGTKKPVFQGGKRVGYVQEFSDTLLIFLLKGAMPKKYGDSMTHKGDRENPVQVSVLDEIIKGS